MYIIQAVYKVRPKRYALRFDVSENSHKRIQQAAEDRQMTVKDWVYMLVLNELERLERIKRGRVVIFNDTKLQQQIDVLTARVEVLMDRVGLLEEQKEYDHNETLPSIFTALDKLKPKHKRGRPPKTSQS